LPLCLVALASIIPPARADDADLERVGVEYRVQIHALVGRFCLECHSTEVKEGELDLERFATLADVRRSPRSWQKVAEMLDNGEMPPKDATQPTPDERRQLRDWVGSYLKAEAHASAGDPGRVVMRRLNNVEYTNTIRDLTGVPLAPAREFPVDGAAGEGFTNTGESLVMSPALLTKYLDAAKEIAAHAVLLPDGFRFSPSTEPGDWRDDLLAEIRAIYSRFADSDGRVPLESYLGAILEERAAIQDGRKDTAGIAAERKLSPKYLVMLWHILGSGKALEPASDVRAAEQPGTLLDALRRRASDAKPEDAAPIVAEIRRWQTALWKTNTVGYFKPRHEPVDPVVASQEFRLKLQPAADAADLVLYLSAGDAGDGSTSDVVHWQNPRFESPNKPPLALRDVRAQTEYLIARRAGILPATTRYLAAAAEAQGVASSVDVEALARRHDVAADALAGWLDYLGNTQDPVKVVGHFANRMTKVGGYDFVQGWGSPETPLAVANSSDQEAHIPGLMKPHSVAVHPAPATQAVVAWQSPCDTTLEVSAIVVRAHTACGNGITWSLELRRGHARTPLAGGTSDQLKTPAAGPIEGIKVRAGDCISLLIGPRDGDHSCDLTEVDLQLEETTGEKRQWQLARDVSADVLAGNPHDDRFGNAAVWHLYTEPVAGGPQATPSVPAGSLLARWRDETDPAVKEAIASAVERLLCGPKPAAGDKPDGVLYRQLNSLASPILSRIADAARKTTADELAKTFSPRPRGTDPLSRWGLAPQEFGHAPDGRAIEATSLAMQAPAVLAVRLPADLVGGGEFVVTGALDGELGTDGSVQLRVSTKAPAPSTALQPGAPILARLGSKAHDRLVASLDEVRRFFPPHVCFPQIVPVDEAVTMEQFHRDDEPLGCLVLDDAQAARLDRLWEELRFVTEDALRVQTSYGQFMEYTTQDRNPADYEPMREPINRRAAAFRQELLDAEPKQLDALVRLASRAYRRPLAGREEEEPRALYRRLRDEELPHDEALRLVLARVLVSPEFLYRVEQPGPGIAAAAVSDWELASRLSYFLWASMPDGELRELVAARRLCEPDVLVEQARRMLRDGRARSLATEFACQWLDIRDFDKLDEKSERHFPTFAERRGDMYEESILFFADVFQNDRSLLELLDCDHTFVNGPLAEHYGIPGVAGPEWRRVDGVRQYGRGGILGLSTTLAKNSGASRTSPILRGNWLLEMVLGEKLPKPPKGVPVLPEDETATEGLTVRQLVEKHRTVGECAVCHAKIDPFGFALEGYDSIGRKRDRDLGDRPIDTRAELPDGTKIDGLGGLRDYMMSVRREQFVRNFCRKLLGYALARGTQLSDEPLLDEMMAQLARNDYRFTAAVEPILRSQQFRFHRPSTDEAEQP
jgi:hypothetical protein